MFVGFLFLVASSCDCFSVLFLFVFFFFFFFFCFGYGMICCCCCGCLSSSTSCSRFLLFFFFSFLFSVHFLLWWILCRTETCDCIDIEMADLVFLCFHLSRIHFSFLFVCYISLNLFICRLPFRNYNLFLCWIHLHFIIVIMNYDRRCSVPYAASGYFVRSEAKQTMFHISQNVEYIRNVWTLSLSISLSHTFSWNWIDICQYFLCISEVSKKKLMKYYANRWNIRRINGIKCKLKIIIFCQHFFTSDKHLS